MPRTNIIASPKLGILNLLGTKGTSLISDDVKILSSLFGKPIITNDQPPLCNVLFIYCRLKEDGSIDGATTGIIDLIRRSHAPIAVIASENPGDMYIEATKDGDFANCNVVMTVERQDPNFGKFFQKVFTEMFLGTPMPMAWVKYAPQVPDDSQTDCPVAICAMAAGNIAFQ